MHKAWTGESLNSEYILSTYFQSFPNTTSHEQMEQVVKFKSDFETRETRRQMVDMDTFNSISYKR